MMFLFTFSSFAGEKTEKSTLEKIAEVLVSRGDKVLVDDTLEKFPRENNLLDGIDLIDRLEEYGIVIEKTGGRTEISYKSTQGDGKDVGKVIFKFENDFRGTVDSLIQNLSRDKRVLFIHLLPGDGVSASEISLNKGSYSLKDLVSEIMKAVGCSAILKVNRVYTSNGQIDLLSSELPDFKQLDYIKVDQPRFAVNFWR